MFGLCGCLRCDEITNMRVQDVEDIGNNRFLVSVGDNKNDYSGQFIIGNLFYNKVKNYISLRPAGVTHDRFFVKYKDDKCTSQPLGIHTIGQVPSHIANFLKLPHVERYTGHCFRRSSATLLSDSGASMQMIKQLGRWRSDAIAEKYIENSLYNRELIFKGLIHEQSKTLSTAPPGPSVTETLPSVRSYSKHTKNLLMPSTSSHDFQLQLNSSISADEQACSGLSKNSTSNKQVARMPLNFTATSAMAPESSDSSASVINDLQWDDFEDEFNITDSSLVTS